MEHAFRLKACKQDTRFVLLSKVIDSFLNAETIDRKDLEEHFDSVEWSTHDGLDVCKCSFMHTTLSCVVFKFDENKIVQHEFA